MRKVMLSLIALLLSGVFATAVQAQRPERPSQRPSSGMMNSQRPRPMKGGQMGMPAEGMKGKSGMKPGHGMPAQDGPRKGKGQRPGMGQRPVGGPKAQL